MEPSNDQSKYKYDFIEDISKQRKQNIKEDENSAE